MSSYANQRILFVTGRLAESSLREVVGSLAKAVDFEFEIVVPGVQVAALMHGGLLKSRLKIDESFDRVIVPGWVQSDIADLTAHFGLPFEAGPKNLHDLPEFFGQGKRQKIPLTESNIEIIAEINHATRQSIADVMTTATSMIEAGADLIDVGCVPGETCDHVGDYVSAMVANGWRISVDSFNRAEVEQAVKAGAELILSCNHSNVDWVTKLGTEVVVIPDTPADTDSLKRLIDKIATADCRFRIDPIIEPIGMGFASSLKRYFDFRESYPEIPMMMGVGNITELTEVDSAGVNFLLAAICEELGILSVLTTEVINWCRTSVTEFDIARRMVSHAVANQVIPKHLMEGMAVLRDPRVRHASTEELDNLFAAITDPNFRIFAAEDGLHLMNRNGHWSGQQPFRIFEHALKANPDTDAAHAFYLGFEMARAEMAQQLGKNYQQDQPLTFGFAGTLPGSSAVHHDTSPDSP